MSTEHCKLAAVLFADMVGYSAKRHDRALESRRQMMSLAAECLAACQGRLIKTAGDEVFAEFPSGSSAIACATRLQRAVGEYNAGRSRPLRFQLRIGINSGEVTTEGADLIGSTVNVAKRAEQLAAPGGICVTEPVWRQADADLQAGFMRLGTIAVKADPPKCVFFHRYDAGTGALAKRTHQFRVHCGRLGRLAFATTCLILLALALRLAWPVQDPEKLVASGTRLIERYDLAQHIDRAIKDFNLAQKLDPASAKATDGLAWAQWLKYKDTGDGFFAREAVKCANSALALNSNNIYADVVLGLYAAEMGASQDVVEHLRRAADHDRWRDGAIIVRLADGTRRAGERATALELAERAEAKAGLTWDAWHQLGVFWDGENNLSNSLRCFDRAASLDPPSSKSAEQANNLLMKCGRQIEALERASRFKDQNKFSADAWSLYGNALLLVDSNGPAFQAFQRAAELDPTNYFFSGKWALALFTVATNAPVWTRLLKDNTIDQSRAVLRDAPGNLQVRTHLATYEAALGEKSSGLSPAERDLWNQAALADADRVLNEKPFSPDLILALETPYYILEKSDRVAQCEARLDALNHRPMNGQNTNQFLPTALAESATNHNQTKQ